MSNAPKHLLKTGAVILAGGKRELTPGLPKLLELIRGAPVLHHVINAVKGTKRINGEESVITVVISSRFEEQLRESLRAFPGIGIAVQDHHLGTADAIFQAIDQDVYPKECGHVFTLMGDQPLVTSGDLDLFFRDFIDQPFVRAAILAFREDRRKSEYQKCARVFFDHLGKFHHLKTRTPAKGDELLHAGPYLFEASWLRGIVMMLKPHVAHSAEKEFHLYEALIGAREDTGVRVCETKNPRHFLGVDNVAALEEVRARIEARSNS